MKDLDIEIKARNGKIRIFEGGEIALERNEFELKMIKEQSNVMQEFQKSKFGRNE